MARPTRFRNKWRVRWIDAQGKRQSEMYSAYDDALFALGRHQVSVEEVRRGFRALEIPNKCFDELCDYWIRTRSVQKRSWKDDLSIIRCHLRPFFGRLRVRDLTVSRVDEFIASRQHLDQKTIHNHLTLLISMLNAAIELGWLARAPKIRKPRIRVFDAQFRYLRTQDEIEQFLRAALDITEMHFMLYATAIYTGMRQGELAGLKWDDVDFNRRLITVQRSYDGPTKAGDVRHVPLLDTLLPLLREWRLKTPGDHVFHNSFGAMLKSCTRIHQEDLRATLRAAGFPVKDGKGKGRGYICFHDLRHTFASHWVLNGGDIFRLQKILGHKSTQMTMRYAHLAPSAYASDYGRLGTAMHLGGSSVVPLKRLKS